MPSDAGRSLGELFPVEQETDRFDFEAGAARVGRPNEDLPDIGRVCPALVREGIGLDLVARNDRCVQIPIGLANTLDVRGVGVLKRHLQVLARRDAQADLNRM